MRRSLGASGFGGAPGEASVEGGATLAPASGGSSTMPPPWEIVILATGTTATIKLTNEATAGNEYLFVDAIEFELL